MILVIHEHCSCTLCRMPLAVLWAMVSEVNLINSATLGDSQHLLKTRREHTQTDLPLVKRPKLLRLLTDTSCFGGETVLL